MFISFGFYILKFILSMQNIIYNTTNMFTNQSYKHICTGCVVHNKDKRRMDSNDVHRSVLASYEVVSLCVIRLHF